jgi:hypothetical protein
MPFYLRMFFRVLSSWVHGERSWSAPQFSLLSHALGLDPAAEVPPIAGPPHRWNRGNGISGDQGGVTRVPTVRRRTVGVNSDAVSEADALEETAHSVPERCGEPSPNLVLAMPLYPRHDRR